jgi:hypothetical protein
MVKGNRRFVAQSLTSFQEDLDILERILKNIRNRSLPFFPAPTLAYRSSWSSTRALAISSWFGWPVILLFQAPSLAWNTVPRSWA